jgi:nucleoside-triphosphatase THEP1
LIEKVISILTGPVHAGKTILLKKTIPLLREKKFRIDGYLSESIRRNADLIGYDLIHLIQNESYPFIRTDGENEWEQIGRFYFLPETLDLAKSIVRECKKADLCVVDEVGPLELSGKGVWPAIEIFLKQPHPHLLLVIRNTLLDDIIEKIPAEDYRVHEIEQTKTPSHLAEGIYHDLEKGRK